MRLAHHRSLDELEQRFVLGQHDLTAIALHALPLHQFTQLDQIVGGWHGDQEIARAGSTRATSAGLRRP